MEKKKIYRYSFGYYLISRIAFFFMRIYYRKIYVRGQENISPDMPVIFAPNHKNGLMDPLLVSYSFRRGQIVYMAVSYLFSVVKLFDKLLRYLKILPVFRGREGVENLGKNEGSFIEAVETLKEGKKLCLMPEGRQIEQRKLLPLVKGMFRIGMYAQEKFGNNEGVKIVPVGIEYEDLRHSGRNALIQFGKPLELSEYFDLYVENPAKAYKTIRDDLYPKIGELLLNVNSQKYYESIYLATILQTDDYLAKHKLENNAWNRLKAKQEIAKQYLVEEKTNPEKLETLDWEMKKLLALGKTDDEICRLMKKAEPVDIIKMLLFLPLFIPGAVFMLVPYCFTKVAVKKILDIGFYSSFSYLCGVVVPAVFFTLCFLISLFFIPPLWGAFVFFIVAPVCSVIAFKLKNLYFDTIQRIAFRRKIPCLRLEEIAVSYPQQ